MNRILPAITLLMVTVLAACSGGQLTPNPAAKLPLPTATATVASPEAGQSSPTPTEMASVIPTTPPPSPTATSSPAVTSTSSVKESFYLLYFYADWCPNCQTMNPMVEELEEEYKGRIKFLWLNVDRQEARQIAAYYRVMAVPTTILANREGRPINLWLGPRGRAFLKEALDRALEGK